jgi:hypothetical protein
MSIGAELLIQRVKKSKRLSSVKWFSTRDLGRGGGTLHTSTYIPNFPFKKTFQMYFHREVVIFPESERSRVENVPSLWAFRHCKAG